jgi:hypothetical protein
LDNENNLIIQNEPGNPDMSDDSPYLITSDDSLNEIEIANLIILREQMMFAKMLKTSDSSKEKGWLNAFDSVILIRSFKPIRLYKELHPDTSYDVINKEELAELSNISN